MRGRLPTHSDNEQTTLIRAACCQFLLPASTVPATCSCIIKAIVGAGSFALYVLVPGLCPCSATHGCLWSRWCAGCRRPWCMLNMGVWAGCITIIV